ncbi:helix-turn-helix transcriptional regulator [Pseudonocardia sp. HH130630-07]|uniref:helix-turn-helix transcriptional regulator n=1 Tax=Pseudonocardia sp. HH130630-07 TaxID=1690815 RepID=UPI0008151568|nr:LuxR C-terminal-related transcriptional regulator [Pseudonocardia sp. HH130630-07]ANY07702.1 hypothetical protein AFB00_16955 [Pseudonocardia sp. HH130630-07]
MRNAPSAPVGREDELAVLAADGPGGVVTVLHGERGSGRSTMLAALADIGRSVGRPVLTVDLAGPRPEWDLYGVVPLLDAVTGRFESLGAAANLVGRTAALRRRCTPGSYRSTVRRGALHAEIGRLLGSLGSAALVLLDDVDHIPEPEHIAVAGRLAGHRVIVTAGRASALGEVADALVHAGPIGTEDLARLVRRALRARPDARLVAALRRALGPLVGNPSAVLATLDHLRRSDRLVTVARRVCLRAPHRPPTLPSDALAVTAVGDPGDSAEEIVLLVDGPARVRVEDTPLLAAACGRTARDAGRTVDRLVADGVLEEHHGALVLRCPAVGATLRARAGTGRVRALHAAVVRASATVPAPPTPEVLSDHVEAAGDALEPGRTWSELLHAQARERERRAPDRAARLVHAAERHDRAEPESEPESGPATGWVLRLLLRAGDHRGVAHLVARIVAGGARDADPELLAAAAAAAALSLDEPVPDAVHRALGRDLDPACPLRLVRDWTAGQALDVQELRDAMRPLLAPKAGPDRRSLGRHAAETALLSRDVVGALEGLLGPAYRRPAHGGHLGPQQVAVALSSGRWEDATDEARALFADHDADESTAGSRELAALLAADAAIWSGDERMAEAWQDYLPDDAVRARHPMLYAAVQATRLWAAGDGATALEDGYRIWTDAQGRAGHVGRRFLLARLCGIAAIDGHRQWHARLHAAAVEWRRNARGAEVIGAAEAWDLADGLFGGGAASEARLARAMEPARNRGHRAKLCWMLLAAGTAVPDPTALWAEAHAVATEIDSPVLRARLRRLVEEHGVRLPVSRHRDSGLTDVQLRIVELVEQGMTNRQIARDLQISEKTVENHLTRLFVRFGCRTRHGLATARIAARCDETEVRGVLDAEDPLARPVSC